MSDSMQLAQRLYRKYNIIYFDGLLPRVEFDLVIGTIHDYHGMYDMYENTVYITERTIKDIEELIGTIIHEMIHVWQYHFNYLPDHVDWYSWHGKKFRHKAKWIEKQEGIYIR